MEVFLRAADGRAFPISAPARMGRDPACEIVLTDERASRVHALVWRDGSVVCLRDEGSSNGTFVNEHQIPPGQVYGLNPGDRFRIGGTVFVVEAAAVAPPNVPVVPASALVGGATVTTQLPPRRSSLPALAIGGCLVLIVLLVCGGGSFLAVSRPPFVQTALAQVAPGQVGTPGPVTVPPGEIRLTILSTSPPPTPFSPQAFAANQSALNDAIAELNRATLDLIQRARLQAGVGGSAPRLAQPALQVEPINEDDINDVVQDAIKSSVLADQLSKNAAAQGGNSPAAQAIAEAYATVASQAAIMAIKADALRQSWLAQQLPLDQLAEKMALVGSAIWNASVTQPGTPGNPFAPYAVDPVAVPNPQPLTPDDFANLLTQLNNPAETLGWVAISPASGEETITLPPASGAYVDLNDPAVIAALTSADTTASHEALVQAARALLGANGAADPSAPTTITVPKTSVVVAEPQPVGPQPGDTRPKLPTFPGGNIIIIAPEVNSVDLVASLATMDGINKPTVNGQTPIDETAPLVALTISNLDITQVNKRAKDAFHTFEADVVYSFDVHWAANLASPQFTLDCVSGNHFEITTVSGEKHIDAKGLLIIYPGSEDAFCYASRNGNTLGSTSVHFLVGDAAGATQRAIQVETDAVALDLTLTADVLGTAGRQQTEAAQTQSVQQTADALSTEQAATRTAEARATATYLAANEALFATQTQAALSADDDIDGVSNADDRCFDRKETTNGWRDEDGCPDVLPLVGFSNAAFVETLTNAPVNTFASVANLTLDFTAATTSGTITGSANWQDSYFCYNTSNPSEVFETVTASYAASYSASVAGAADGVAHTFDGSMDVTGVTHITLNQQFTVDGCTHLNSDNLDDHWGGFGEVRGAWDGASLGSFNTDWATGDIEVAGSYTGAVTITEQAAP